MSENSVAYDFLFFSVILLLLLLLIFVVATDGFDVAVVVAIAAFVDSAVVADEPLPSHQLGMPPPSQSQLVHPSLWHFSANQHQHIGIFFQPLFPKVNQAYHFVSIRLMYFNHTDIFQSDADIFQSRSYIIFNLASSFSWSFLKGFSSSFVFEVALLFPHLLLQPLLQHQSLQNNHTNISRADTTYSNNKP